MNDEKIFPFPDREQSKDELTRDLLYQKIPEEKINPIFEHAWNTGETAAKNLVSEYPGKSVYEIAKLLNLKIQKVDVDQVAGNIRYFSEYFSGRKTIYLYMKSIKKWAEANEMSLAKATELVLSHEIFHHLECTTLGLTSEQYKIPIIRIGRFAIGKSGVRALSEVGAHGFARTFYELKCAE